MPAGRRPASKPKTPEELRDGARLVRQVLTAIPPELDEQEDAVLREVIEGYARSASLAASEDRSDGV